jgi:hypothetical protein
MVHAAINSTHKTVTMKKQILKYFIPVAAVFFLYACTKKDGVTNQTYQTYGTTGKGQLKINLAFAYTVDYATLLIKVNGTAVSNSLQTRTPFPGGGFNTRGSNFALYLSVPQGTNAVSVVIPKVGTTTDSVVLFTGNVTLPDSNPYTLHIADTAANTKSVLVKNEIGKVDSGFCRFRFIHLIPNVASVDLYLNDVKIRSAVPYAQVTDTFSVRTGVNAPGYTSGGVTTWAIRPAGAAATSTALASYPSASTLQSEMVLTIFSMGYSGSTGTRLPFLAFTLDKNQ